MIANSESLSMPTMSFEEFLEWSDEDTRAEWINGKVEFRVSASKPHGILKAILCAILIFFVHKNKLGTVVNSDALMRLTTRPSGRQPDILFLQKSNSERYLKQYLNGPADLVIEIVSPESVERDNVEKFAEYAEAGVEECWIIDPEAQIARFFVLRNASYEEVSFKQNGFYDSAVLKGFSLPVNLLWTPDSLLDHTF